MIEISNLTVDFAKYKALENINLVIPENCFVSVVGPNGAGKSTLLRVLLGVIKPTSGSVSIFNKAADEVAQEIIGYVPQIKTLDRTFPALPIELVTTGFRGKWVGRLSKKDTDIALSALEQVGASHLAKRPLSKLSGGELQRIYLARSFVRKPKILLLDEPATGIDMLGEKDMHKLIDEYKASSGATVIMVTHDWESAIHHANYALLLNRSVVCFDSPAKAFTEKHLGKAFGHIGHDHDMSFVGGHGA
jgi:zinc transport system ATP-binding protein